MNLSEKIAGTTGIITFRSQELYSLLQFVRDFDAYIRHQTTQGVYGMLTNMPSNIQGEFKQYLAEYSDFLSEFVNECINTKGEAEREFRPQKNYPQEVTKYLWPFLSFATVKAIRYPRFLYDMTLTHTITIFESFLTDFLIAIFTLRPSTLKSENTATYKDILSFSTRKKLIGHLASNRAEKTLEGDLYCDVADKLNKLFSIDISKFSKFNIIYEAFCRRHVIVHNDGVTDKEYCKKIPNSKIGVYLDTDLQYIETLFITIGQFIDYLDNCFSRKMRYRRYPLVNQLLNPSDSVEGPKNSS